MRMRMPSMRTARGQPDPDELEDQLGAQGEGPEHPPLEALTLARKREACDRLAGDHVVAEVVGDPALAVELVG
jgi:hypothetical protein